MNGRDTVTGQFAKGLVHDALVPQAVDTAGDAK